MVSSGRLGIYFRGIARMQGWSQDLIKALSQGGNKVKVKDIVPLYINITKISKLQRAVRVKALPKGWEIISTYQQINCFQNR
jgi:hypothetical protein